jgi:RHS repeat-associated protein
LAGVGKFPCAFLTQKERDSESGLDYFLARYYSSAQGRFSGVDPYNPIVDSENKKQFTRYLDQPQNWNRYVYVWNNPLKYIDPDGERVFVVTHTVGNKEGDEEFRRVAETYANQIRNSEGYDPEKDTVIVRGVNTKEDFEGVVMEANGLETQFGKIQEVALVSHAGRDDGPIFPGGKTTEERQYMDATTRLPQLWFNFSSTAEAKFMGCNTALKFCQNFANAQRVPAWGFDDFSSISSSPDKKSKGYWFYPYKGPLYMVRDDGKGMVRRDPSPKDKPRK